MNKLRKRGSHLRSNSDVLSQLGEPLPLPYKPDPKGSSIKLEDDEQTAVDTKELNEAGIDKDIPTIFGTRGSQSQKNAENETHLINISKKPRPISLRQKYFDKPLSIQRPITKASSRDYISIIEEKLEKLRELSQDRESDDIKELELRINSLIDVTIHSREQEQLERQREQLEKERLEIARQEEEAEERKRYELERREEEERLAQQEFNGDEQMDFENQPTDINSTFHEGFDIIKELERVQRMKNLPNQTRNNSYIPKFNASTITIITLSILVIICVSIILSGLNYEYCYYFC